MNLISTNNLAQVQDLVSDWAMAKHCEACSSDRHFEHCPRATQRVRNVLIGNRIVQLCDEHARRAREGSVSDEEALMQLTRVRPPGRIVTGVLIRVEIALRA